MDEEEKERWNRKKQTLIDEISDKLINGDVATKIQAAREIRSMIRNRNSSGKIRVKFAAAGVIQPLVLMLCSQQLEAREVSLLALLNLASRNERNKEQIVTCGAIPPLVKLLKFQNTSNLRELATAAILTLSAAPNNRPTISSSGAVPLLIQILSCGSVQGRVDAVTALHNLTTSQEEPIIALDATAALPLINLLKECKKYSKFAEKTTSLLEIISKSPQGMLAITKAQDGILTLVETIEDGSLVSTNHAVSVLLALCMSSRNKYRELILNEGAIPGLLRLTVDGTHEAQNKARLLLDLLRDTTPEKRLSSSVLEKMVHEIAARVDGSEKPAETAKILLQDMVQRSMNKGSSRTP
ncbi:putative armadillo-like helical protein [Helianthus debilis subsp. tardiflorus]